MGQTSSATELGHDDSGSVSIDVIALLGDRRRRTVLETLAEDARTMALRDLAEDVAVDEHDGPASEISADTVQRIATSLYHVHIPQLVDAGVVEYDMDRDEVRPSGRTDRIERALSVIEAAKGS